MLELLEVICDSKLYPREHFLHQYNVYLKPALIQGFEREFANRQQVLYQLAVLLRKFDSMDPTLWDLWVKRVVSIKRVQNIEDFDKFLHMLLWVNEYPKSPKFGLISNEIEIFKDQIKKNPNRFWKYDPDVI
jgi:hypothetical protein